MTMKIISKKSVILTSITTLVLIMSVNTQAKIYKWTDANGQTHYTAYPPKQKGTKATDIEDKIKAQSGKYRPSAKTKKVASYNSSDNDNSQNDDSGEELSGPDKQLSKYCKGQRNNIKQLKKNFRNVWVGVDGKKTSLTQEQRKEKVALLQKQIDSNCSEVKVSENS